MKEFSSSFIIKFKVRVSLPISSFIYAQGDVYSVLCSYFVADWLFHQPDEGIFCEKNPPASKLKE